MADFKVEDFTRNVKIGPKPDYEVTGDGVFDKLMITATKHLESLFLGNRIRQEDYAYLYADIYKATLTAAMQAETEGSKAKLIKRQIQGFSESYKKDILKICLEAWEFVFSVSEEALYDEDVAAKSIPVPITASTLNNLWKEVLADIDEPIKTTKSWVMED